MPLTRRALSSHALTALATAGLCELLWSRDVVAAAVRPKLGAWLAELGEMTRALHGRSLGEREFQGLLDDLCARVDLDDLCAGVDLDALATRMRLPARGAATVDVDLAALAGAPSPRLVGRRVFGCRKGRAIVPHGHDDLCTGFIVLAGRWRGRHYDRLETHADQFVIRPTIDREFAPGDHSTVSDHRDNVHWFEALSDRAFVFNVHVGRRDGAGGRVYLDPDGERLADGSIRAPRLSHEACLARYGAT
ncbi:hypothetical protein [Nannocystis radixulma]|uniref:Uncharacterized protein n=1 Tax=Nannocystis radixulma TaxID=2995305 RepID=A0ABT5BFK4_9BACT|nr:hypothetical protein [Nannocystis radixulma]MDC0672930.1 hypothetical protein [Nannocystis radixulma]